MASWKTAADAGITGSLPAGMLGQTLRHDGFSWIANSVIFNNGTDVGIGTNAPAAKLDINGQIMIRGGLPGAGKVLTSNAVGLASWETPASGTASGSCPAGAVVTGIDVSGKIICTPLSSLCTPTTCSNLGYNCGSWPDGCGNTLDCGTCPTGQTCASGTCATSCTPKTCAQQGFTCGSQNDTCGGSLNCGTCPTGQTCVSGTCKDEDCKGNNLGGKRIFVTSAGYTGHQVRTNADADAICQDHASTAGLTGTYKALVYLDEDLPETVLPLGYAFYNGQYTGSYCNWREVAGSRALMWSLPLKNPILYDEYGNIAVLQSVWTNFISGGSGTYTVLDICGWASQAFGLAWPCLPGATGSNVTSNYKVYPCVTAYYGDPTKTDVNWSGIFYHTTAGLCTDVNCAWNEMSSMTETCQNFQRALYCVQQ
ncbi:MAG TPA: hypothetical protein P5080_04860 [Candidatus Paceibacterota bacterium]|nr:hypothetical protein [Candidatus Paceibacterota bacterium]HSA37004.1 hypothetical protein [Candidatus Paceibacterota bacterium]